MFNLVANLQLPSSKNDGFSKDSTATKRIQILFGQIVQSDIFPSWILTSMWDSFTNNLRLYRKSSNKRWVLKSRRMGQPKKGRDFMKHFWSGNKHLIDFPNMFQIKRPLPNQLSITHVCIHANSVLTIKT